METQVTLLEVKPVDVVILSILVQKRSLVNRTTRKVNVDCTAITRRLRFDSPKGRKIAMKKSIVCPAALSGLSACATSGETAVIAGALRQLKRS